MGMMTRWRRVVILTMILADGINAQSSTTPLLPAMFVFGDSLVDNGNNNYLSSLAKSNYYPYGIDFFGGPTGRFSNGRTFVDYLGELLGLPLLPAYSNAYSLPSSTNIMRGVNFASAAAGILDETGRQMGDRISMSKQVENFEKTIQEIRNQMMEGDDFTDYLANSLAVVILGSNDYINNYLLPIIYSTSRLYSPKDYSDLLINRYSSQILALHRLGLRKFLLAGIGPLGCTPNQRASPMAPPGRCVSTVNEMVGGFNSRLKTLVDELNLRLRPNSTFVYGNTYAVFGDILNNPSDYGFRFSKEACCGIGRNRGQITCLPLEVPCTNRDQYIFWDAFHPSEAANRFIALRAFAGLPTDCHPMNIQQLSQHSNAYTCIYNPIYKY